MSEKDLWFLTGDYAGRRRVHSQPARDVPIRLRLERYGARRHGIDLSNRRAVLLLHGASANHLTFTSENLDGTVGVPEPQLANWLLDEGLDPWLLDWRGSNLVVEDKANQPTLARAPDVYTLSHAAAEDLPAAIIRMRKTYGVKGPIAVLGHCMGGAVVAEAVATGHLEGLGVDRIVLLAIGLFYETPIDSRLKSEERILERLMTTGAATIINPRFAPPTSEQSGPAPSGRAAAMVSWPWPGELKRLFDFWPQALQGHSAQTGDEIGATVEALCNRVSFMYGMPYHEPNLVDAIHGGRPPGDGGTVQDEVCRRKILEQRFGGIPLFLFLHCARNLRHGQAMIATSDGQIGKPVASHEARARFLELDRVTLLTGAFNRLWHRDGIDRMFEWLTRGVPRDARHVHKHVLEDYGHQDLLWGRDSRDSVYPTILAAIVAPGQPRLTGQTQPSSRVSASSQRLNSRGIATS